MKSALSFCLASLLLVAACNSSSTNDGSLTICRNLPVIDASTSTCSVDQALLSCTSPDGSSTEICLSDNINGCPDDTAVGNCTSECPSGEYAAACGGTPYADGAAPSNAPPASNCHDPQPTPAGVIFYCCPCGS